MHKLYILLIISILLFLTGSVFLFMRINSYRKIAANSQNTQQLAVVSTIPLPSVTIAPVSPEFLDPLEFLQNIQDNLPQVDWNQIYDEEFLYPYNGKNILMKKLEGSYILQNLKDQEYSLNDFKPEAWEDDDYLFADGPGGSSGGYVYTNGNKRQIVVFLRQNSAVLNKDENEDLACPCNINLIAWASEPFEESPKE